MSLPFRVYPVRQDEVLRRSAMRNPSPEELRLPEECRRDGEYVLDAAERVGVGSRTYELIELA